ncbi:MAG: V-type ATPase subunit [Gammaproteobacteria bacterium]
MILAADQAYLRTRLAILNAKRRDHAELKGLLDHSKDELREMFGIDRSTSREAGLMWLEQSLMQTWLNELSALLRPLKGGARDFLVQWARRYELLNLKALIRGKIGGMSRAEIESSLFDLPGFLTLDHPALLNTDDVMEMLRRLQNTPYRRLGRFAMSRFEERQDPFVLEATLDQQFYGELADRVGRLESIDQAPMRELVGHVLDRHNLVLGLRYRFNYGLQPSEVIYLSIRGGWHLGRDRLREVMNGQSLDECLFLLPESLNRLLADSENIVEVEHRLVADLQARAERDLKTSPSVLASVYAYLILRYYELKKTHAIVMARFNDYPDELLHTALFPTLSSGMGEAA